MYTMFQMKKLLFVHTINNDIEIECSNLWYWLEEEVNNDNNSIATDEDVKYTKELVNVFKGIQKILFSNKIKYSILDIEDDEEDE